jgi:hypothetical protein
MALHLIRRVKVYVHFGKYTGPLTFRQFNITNELGAKFIKVVRVLILKLGALGLLGVG